MIDWRLVRHFKRSEFGTGDPCVELDPGLVGILDDAREAAGVPFVITSGLRTTAKNREIGGAPNSPHLTGFAADIACSNPEIRYRMVVAMLAAGVETIGIYPHHLHVDATPTDAGRILYGWQPG